MALKNVPAASSRAPLLATNSVTAATAAAAASAKSAASPASNATFANAAAPDSPSTALFGDFLALLTGFGAQAAPPAKPKGNAAPPTVTPAAATGSAGAPLPAALLAPAPPTLPAVATPATTAPTAAAPAATPAAGTAPNAIPPALGAPAPTTLTPPTVMPAAAASTSAAPSRTTAAAAKTSATPSSDAKSGKPTSPARPDDTDAEDNTDAPHATAIPSDAWLSSGIRVPTLQPPVASLAPTASTLMGATATNDSEESESTADPVDTTETSTDSTPEVTKSVTEPVAFALGANAPLPGIRSDSAAAAAADGIPSATAAAAAAQAGPLQNPAHAQPATDARAPTEIRAPVGSPAWTEELGTQLTWMTSHGQDSASLRLAPEHLGPVEVRIDVRDGAASVWFGAAHADTRSALEQSLPRLRELFAASGLLLADAGVARDAPRQNARPVAPVPLAGSAGDTSITTSKASSSPTHSGLVDTYV